MRFEPAGAASWTAPVLDCPPASDAGAKTTLVGTSGVTVIGPLALAPLAVAVTSVPATVFEAAVVSVNEADELPGGTTTEAGTPTSCGLALLSVTVTGDPGATGPVSVNVQAAGLPPVTFAGRQTTLLGAGGWMVTVAAATPFADALMSALVTEATGLVAMVNSAVVCPAGITTEAGTVAAGLSLASGTVVSAAAGARSEIVACMVCPPVTALGLTCRGANLPSAPGSALLAAVTMAG